MSRWQICMVVVAVFWLVSFLAVVVQYRGYRIGVRGRGVPAVVWLDPDGEMVQRLVYYQKYLSKIRTSIWSYRTTSCPWQDIKVNEIEVLDPFYAGFMEKLSSIKNVTTVYLSWRKDYSQSNTQNRVMQRYYGWAADPQLCSWIQNLGQIDPGWAYTIFCPTNRSGLLTETKLHLQHYYRHEMYSNVWHRKVTLELPKYVTYLNIFQDVFLDSDGVVYTDKWKIYPFLCTWKMPAPKRPREEYKSANLYWEVFTIAQIFGEQVYHRNIDQLPRLALYFNFLKAHPEIRIHLGRDMNKNTMYMMWIFGFQNRVVAGSLRTKVLYSPEAVPCGYVNLPETQALYLKYQDIIKKNFDVKTRKSIIIIRRTSKERRYLVQQKDVEEILERLAKQFGLIVEIFSDNSIPSMEETMKLFNRAVLVFGIHGAGLANIMFCRQGTYVIEVLSGPPRTKMCFQRLAHIIGLRYYGIAGSNLREITVDIKHVKDIFDFYMPHVANLSKKYN